MKKLPVAFAALSLLAFTACGNSTDSATSSNTASPSAVASSSVSESPTPSPTETEDTITHIQDIPEGSNITARVTANGAYRVAYDDADGNMVTEKFAEVTPFEVTIPNVTSRWSIQADNPSNGGATEIKCEILVDGEVVAWQTQAENENQSYPTTYCAVTVGMSR